MGWEGRQRGAAAACAAHPGSLWILTQSLQACECLGEPAKECVGLCCISYEGCSGQVWEVDRKLLQQHALPTVEAYGYTTETLLRALDMDEFLPGPVGAPAKLLGGPRVSRRAIRAGRCNLCPLC